MYSVLAIALLLLCSVSGEHVSSRVKRQGFQLGQQAPDPTCTSPTGATGKCISVIRCPDIFQILTTRPIPPGQLNFLKESVCGRDEFNRPKFCCAPRQVAVVNLGFPPSTTTTKTTPKPPQNNPTGTTESLTSTTVASTTTTQSITSSTTPTPENISQSSVTSSTSSSTTEPTTTTVSVLPASFDSDAPSSDTPSSDSDAPSSDSDAPSSDSGAPSSDSGAPSSDSGAPSSDSGSLSSDSSAPSTDPDAPSTDPDAPSTDSDAPASDSDSPSSNSDSPSSDSNSPSSDSSTPSSDSSTPSSDSSTPSSDSSTPSSDSSTSSSDSTTPSSDSTTLVSGSTAPVSNSTTPSSDSTTPSSDSTTPSSDSTTPSSDSTTLASDSTTSSTTSSTTTAPIPTQSQTLPPSEEQTEMEESIDATTKVSIVDTAISVDESGSADAEDSILPRLSECGSSNASIPRIVGGRNSNKGDWPWIAVLGFADGKGIDFSCGGTLITRKHVITAAHCVKDLPLRVIRLGEHILSKSDDGNHQDFTPKRKILHPEYNSNYRNDIAILELDREVTFEEGHIVPACLPSPETYDGSVVDGAMPFVAGWGALGYSKDSADNLQDVQVQVVNTQICDKAYARFKTVTIDERTLCAGWRTGGQDACQGDSGGPLVQIYNPLSKYFLVGVVSLGYKCAEAEYPGIYSRVSYYMPWILDTINNRT